MKNSKKSTLLPHWGRWWHQSSIVTVTLTLMGLRPLLQKEKGTFC